MLLLLALSGCTSGSADAARVLGSAVTEPDPTLPAEMEVAPAKRPATSAEVAISTVTAAYAAPVAAAPSIFAPDTPLGPKGVAARSAELDRLISRYAAHYEVPESLVRRVVKRESTFDPAARNGPYWGLMQILPQTARTMGYHGSNEGLLDAETNLKYAVRYLRGAWLTAGGDEDQAVRYYARGYYYDAKRAGLLDETGLGRDRHRMR
jgi:soluble lytic murein transglycosylase-like protein